MLISTRCTGCSFRAESCAKYKLEGYTACCPHCDHRAREFGFNTPMGGEIIHVKGCDGYCEPPCYAPPPIEIRKVRSVMSVKRRLFRFVGLGLVAGTLLQLPLLISLGAKVALVLQLVLGSIGLLSFLLSFLRKREAA